MAKKPTRQEKSLFNREGRRKRNAEKKLIQANIIIRDIKGVNKAKLQCGHAAKL